MTQTIEQLSFSEKFCQSKFKNGIDRQEAISKDWEQLTARVRELEEEIERLRADNIAFARNLKGKSATTGATYEHICTQLAAEQLNNKLLLEALKAVIKVHGYESGIPVEAISTPASTEALDKYVAEKVKEYGDEARRQMQHATKAVWQRDLAVEALHYCVKQVPELATVPGIATAIKESEVKR